MFGPIQEDGKVRFRLWAPYCNEVKLRLNGSTYAMAKDERGYHEVELNAKEGDNYTFLTDLGEVPDPASRYQPGGVHERSQLTSREFPWEDEGFKPSKNNLIIYELHVGTFSKEGTFNGVISKLDYLSDLGVTALELMPVAQFPGNRGWGYDGVYLYAVQNSYGGPQGLKRLVNEAHKRGLSVILDVVYNHVGPEGNYMIKLGPYFSEKYKTPWGLTFNYDDRGSDEVRRFVLENVKYWIDEFHIDGFRLDAVHAIFDSSPKHILEEIAEVAHSRGRFVIAESDLNDPRIVNDKERCGYGIDSQWVDDFHHSVHAYLTGERDGFYMDFGELRDISKALTDTFVYDGRYSKFRGKTHGRPINLPGGSFVVYIQDHDMVGNRGGGERLISLIDKDAYMIAAALYLLSPFIPMIFMGEEYGERNPFLYFSDFSDPKLIEGVREGRKRENGQVRDPQSEETFLSSKLSFEVDQEILDTYKRLIEIRKRFLDHERDLKVIVGEDWMILIKKRLLMMFAFKNSEIAVDQRGDLLLSSNPSFPPKLVSGRYRLSKGFGVYLTSRGSNA
ncbi:MAG: malto-oligosyltrehalose trehalohydrolase [Metallosphaera sp.]